MTNTQRIIKYCALAFAFVLIVNIFGGIIMGISAMSGMFSKDVVTLDPEDLHTLDLPLETTSVINIDVGISKLTIINGEELKVKTNNEHVKVKQEEGKLFIKEEDTKGLSYENSEVVLYIPKDTIFERFIINSGIGTVDVDKINTNYLNLTLGIGNADFSELNVSKEANIDGGIGTFFIEGGSIHNLDLSMGVGESNITSLLTGECELEGGMGKANINLNGNKEDYQINIDKGIGIINIDNIKMSDDSTFGNGFNTIDLEGGIGNIEVNFESVNE